VLSLITICTLFGAIYGQTPMCLNGGPPGRMPSGNQLCNQYNSQACCGSSAVFTQVSSLTCASNDGCGSNSLSSCASMLYDLSCAKTCDSQITQFSTSINFGAGRNYSLCSSWTNSLIANCGNAKYCNSTAIAGLPQNCLSNNGLCVSPFVDPITFAPLTGASLITNTGGILYRALGFVYGSPPLSNSDSAYISTGNSPSCFNGPNTSY